VDHGLGIYATTVVALNLYGEPRPFGGVIDAQQDKPQNSDRLPGTNMTACLVMADIAEDVAQAASFREPEAALQFFDQEFSRLYHGGPIKSITDAQKWQNGMGRAPEMAFYASNGSGFQERYRDTGTEGVDRWKGCRTDPSFFFLPQRRNKP
jgi:hypothetical protein